MKEYLDEAIRAADQGLRAIDTNTDDLDELLARYAKVESPQRTDAMATIQSSPTQEQRKELHELESFLSRQTASLDRMSALPALTPTTQALDNEIDDVLARVMKMENDEKNKDAGVKNGSGIQSRKAVKRNNNASSNSRSIYR